MMGQIEPFPAPASRRPKRLMERVRSELRVRHYSIRTEEAYQHTIESFERVLGLSQLYVIHFNDSKKDLGSRVDRHHHIGKGLIGLPAFQFFLKDHRLQHIPKLLETPKGDESEHWDRRNLDLLRSLI